MRIFKQDVEIVDAETLSAMESETEFIIAATVEGISAVGEMLQLADVNMMSEGGQKRIGSVLLIMSAALRGATETQEKIYLQR